eukprot:Skav212112  [mRNA]  locus=scaffold4272:179396:186179:+ [translate_table: standard]
MACRETEPALGTGRSNGTAFSEPVAQGNASSLDTSHLLATAQAEADGLYLDRPSEAEVLRDEWRGGDRWPGWWIHEEVVNPGLASFTLKAYPTCKG